MIGQILLQTIQDGLFGESEAMHLIDHIHVNSIVAFTFGGHHSFGHLSFFLQNAGHYFLLSRLVNVPFTPIFGHICLFLALLRITVFTFFTLIFVGKLMVDAIVKVLVVEFFICPVNFSDTNSKPDQLIFVFHFRQTVLQ